MLIVGIDSAKNRVDAVALLDGKYYEHVSVDVPKELSVERGISLKVMSNFMTTWLSRLAAKTGEQPQVFVEDAIAVRNLRVAIQLAHSVGMLLALPHPVHLVPIDSWKQVLIKGGVAKEVVRAAVISRYPETAELYGKRQDLFDATGVAIYGDSVLRRG